MNTLTMKNKTNHDFDMLIGGPNRDSDRPLSALRNDRYIDIPGLDGSLHRSGNLQMMTFTVYFVCKAKTSERWFQQRNKIAAWLHTEDEVEIRVDDEPGIHYKGKVTQFEIPTKYDSGVTFSAEFTVQPFRFKNKRNIDVDSYESSRFYVANEGNYDADYILIADVEEDSNIFSIAVGDSRLTYRAPVSFGDRVTIDTAKKELRLNGNLKVLELSGTFSKLQPGDNILSVSADSYINMNLQEVFI